MAQVVGNWAAFTSEPDERGRFGQFGGKYAPETVMGALDELEAAFEAARADPAFMAEFARLEAEYVGRPTPLYHAAALTKKIGGAQIYLKREDLAHTGAHKINNALGPGLLAARVGKRRVIAEARAGEDRGAAAPCCGEARPP